MAPGQGFAHPCSRSHQRTITKALNCHDILFFFTRHIMQLGKGAHNPVALLVNSYISPEDHTQHTNVCERGKITALDSFNLKQIAKINQWLILHSYGLKTPLQACYIVYNRGSQLLLKILSYPITSVFLKKRNKEKALHLNKQHSLPGNLCYSGKLIYHKLCHWIQKTKSFYDYLHHAS